MELPLLLQGLHLLKARATLKHTKLIAGRIEALLVPNGNTITTLAINFNGLN
jgi:hypothetical protein